MALSLLMGPAVVVNEGWLELTASSRLVADGAPANCRLRGEESLG